VRMVERLTDPLVAKVVRRRSPEPRPL